MPIEMVKHLHTALVDTRAAYEVALKETEDQDVAALCKQMISLRHTDHMGLHQALVVAGETPDENGSFMSMVHETVIRVRAAFTGIGKKTIPAFVSGEKDILEVYDAALSEAKADPALSEVLTRQRETLVLKIAEMEKIAT
jgi:uncharacterized protein (TIGR02284 family)